MSGFLWYSFWGGVLPVLRYPYGDTNELYGTNADGSKNEEYAPPDAEDRYII